MTPKPKTLNDWLYIEMERHERILKQTIDGHHYRLPARRKAIVIRRCKRIIKSIKQLLIVQGLNPDKREPTLRERLNDMLK